MDVALRGLVCSLSVMMTSAPGALSEPPAKALADKEGVEYADPKSTYRTYIEAVRKNDAPAAKKCYVVDDDNKSGALDVIVGMWISTRRLNHLAVKTFGEEGVRAIPKGWRRDDVTDQALDLTKKRLDDAEVAFRGDTAELKIKWREEDGIPNPAFEFGEPTHFRKVGGNWKIDANRMTGLKRAADFFKPGSWGPMFRDQVAIMDRAVEEMEEGRLKTSRELRTFIEGEVAVMVKKYEEEMKRSGRKEK